MSDGSQAGRAGRGVRGAELLLGLLVLGVVAMMIVPLPTALLDLLLAANLSASIAILLVVLYVPRAMSIATFPTVLLLTTLLRLALNVSSTRLILLQADAGEVIRAFGSFVVRGNYVVGGVVFLVLTVIQFVVIARGSGRVAEVAARFVLDATPGKQLAIDAELRAGTIDGAEARRRRRELAREGQFYGAMDGAMTFVKGDVVASLVITLVNLAGGLAIGVGQRGMPAVDALKRYGLLTIGDGLVTQIPALVLSTAAGVLVTRTASEEPDTPLGEELSRGLLAEPRALRVASVFILLLAAVPGLPAFPFLILGTLVFVVSRARSRRLAREAAGAESALARPDSVGGPAFIPVVDPWSVEVSPDLAALLDTKAGIRAGLLGLRERFFADLGVPLPTPRVRVTDALAPRSVRVSVHEVPAGTLSPPDGLADASVPAWVEAECRAVLAPRAADLLGIAETQRLLDTLEAVSPAAVRQVVPKPISVPLLAEVLRRLVDEGVSVRDLGAILEALAAAATTERDPLALAEHCRTHLRRAITFKLTAGSGTLAVVTVDPTIEDAVRRAVTRTANGAFLALPPAVARDIIAAARRATGEAEAARAQPVVLTHPDIRRFTRKLLEPELPHVAVVSFAELLPEVALLPVARAHLGGIGT